MVDGGYVADAVPVLCELRGDVLECGVALVARLERNADHGGPHEHGLVRGVVVEAVDEALPSRLVCQLRRHLVEHPHPRGEVRLGRELAQQPAREPVEGGDGSEVGLGNRDSTPFTFGRVGGGLGPAFELHPDAALQLGRRGLGERDGGDLGESDTPVDDEVGDPFDELRRLAAAGPGLDEQRASETTAADELPSRGVDDLDLGAHGASGSRRSRMRSSGAPTLASACSPRSREHTRSNSQ